MTLSLSPRIVNRYILEEHRNTTLTAFPGLGDPTAPGSASFVAREAVNSSGSSDVRVSFFDAFTNLDLID